MGKDRKKALFGIMQGIIVLGVFIGIAFYIKYPKYDENKQYVKEYVVGEKGIKGQVDKSWFETKQAYEIGANEEGYAVFKDPNAAFRQIKIDFLKGIKAIAKEADLLPLSRWNFLGYKAYSSQLNETKDEEALNQAAKLGGYLDIYENSFEDFVY